MVPSVKREGPGTRLVYDMSFFTLAELLEYDVIFSSQLESAEPPKYTSCNLFHEIVIIICDDWFHWQVKHDHGIV